MTKKMREKLEIMSFYDLMATLQYLESICAKFQELAGGVMSEIQKNVLTESETAIIMKKLQDGYASANEISFAVEKILDQRIKQNLNLKYGTQTIVDLNNEVAELIKEREKNTTPKKGKMKLT